QAGIEPSVGSVGDSYDNALAESVIGLFKTAWPGSLGSPSGGPSGQNPTRHLVIRRRGPWRSIDDVEFAVLEWVDWFNHRRLFEPIGHIPPAQHEHNYYRQPAPVEALGVTPTSLQ
ncbi:MAG: hypothetical protein ABR592_08395, partial [Nitriliruptorales bacterium]